MCLQTLPPCLPLSLHRHFLLPVETFNIQICSFRNTFWSQIERAEEVKRERKRGGGQHTSRCQSLSTSRWNVGLPVSLKGLLVFFLLWTCMHTISITITSNYLQKFLFSHLKTKNERASSFVWGGGLCDRDTAGKVKYNTWLPALLEM